MDSDYWKRAYATEWDRSARRERELAEMIEQNACCTVEYMGLGAGSSNFIHGTAEANGAEKGDPDLHVAGTNIYIEVTGPLQDSVGSEKPLWIRPDKIDNAEKHLGEHETFIAHNCPSENLWRIIHIDDEFVERRSTFTTVRPYIRGRQEEYLEIRADDVCLHGIDYLYSFIYSFITLDLDESGNTKENILDKEGAGAIGDDGTNMTLEDFGTLSSAAKIIDLYLADVLGFERVPRRHYIGYCQNRRKMDVTLSLDKANELRVRMAKPLTEIRDSKNLCHMRSGNPSQPTEMIVGSNAQIVYALVILNQVGGEQNNG